MAHYYFDSDDGETFLRDEVGLTFTNVQAAATEAARALAELAREVIPGQTRRELFISVRDKHDQRLLRSVFIFEAQFAS
jgi:hypothetical protein